MTYDVITIGETMLRLSPSAPQTLEQSNQYHVHVGGSESNVAIGLARLGLNVAWVSRITKNALGNKLVTAIRAHGVDTSHVIRTDDDRVGLYWYDAGSKPRSSTVIYDRAQSAMSKMLPEELPTSLFQPRSAKLLHITGISLAIGESAKQTIHEAVQLAKQAGYLVSFDINYRSLLWSPQQARDGCHSIAQSADIIFLTSRDASTLYDCPTDYDSAISVMSQLYPNVTIVMTLGKHGAMAQHGNKTLKQNAYPTHVIDRLGGGDAFVAGFLYAYLSNSNIQQALQWGCASAAYKYSIAGDMPLLNKQQLQMIVSDQTTTDVIR